MNCKRLLPWLLAGALSTAGCAVVTAPYQLTKAVVKSGIWAVKTTYQVTAGTSKVVYHIGEFTYEVVKAPLDWALTQDIEEIDGLPPREAIRLGRVKAAPYTVKGERYSPMSMAKAESYRETGIASWYGWETRRQKGGSMTANGEVFDPAGLTAAHKYLPIPCYAKVTNLANGRAVIVRVNDRGPFASDHNPRSGQRIIDLSRGAAQRLGYLQHGTARVRVEAMPLTDNSALMAGLR